MSFIHLASAVALGLSFPNRITASTRLAPGVALVPNAREDGSGAALVIEGDNIVVDFAGAVLRGSPETVAPNARAGTGIVVKGRNVTIKNARVHGFKIGLIARDCPNLTIENGDFSYNWKQRLASTLEREDLSDWMSYHQNEKDEWLRYGAGIYLSGCDGFRVRKTRVVGGQCGLMLNRSNQGVVTENDFSFLSGIGIGLYRSSENRIQHNKIDWCVRGYSHGVYNRGQDSAGILIFEQSSRNIFAYNSVTHGGDGFFLWAGQTTMDTGKGGCDDNLLWANDFSHAPTNGIEATFSRNVFANNLVLECWHGVWGGYSYDTKIVGNVFGRNAEAIAIEHGRDNVIAKNTFLRDRTGIRLWKNATQDPSWGYGKFHETTSRDYRVAENRFVDVPTPIRATDTDRVFESANRHAVTNPAPEPTMEPSGNPILASESDRDAYRRRFLIDGTDWNPTAKRVADIDAPSALVSGKAALPFLPKNSLRGRRHILVDEWGPYDFRRPILWPRGGDGVFEILGPKGKWRVVSAEGATLSAQSGVVPGQVTVTLPPGKAGRTEIALEYVGERTVDVRGVETPAGTPVAFGYERFFAPIAWNVSFFTWEKDASDPRTQPDAFAARLKEKPVATLTTDRLEFGGAFARGVPANYFATVAEGTFTIPPGDYLLEITTDDGCRAWLDGKPILTDAWKYQGPTLYPIPLTLGGKHVLRVEHFQIDGYAALQVKLRPRAK